MPFRERRFEVMLDVLAALKRGPVVVVDLACGPGAISQRVLRRFPRARCLAVDFDPVLLRIGREALGSSRRLRWVEADLRQPGWSEQLPAGPVDAFLSTTALHWLTAPELFEVYREAAQRLRRGGLFLNGDHVRYSDHLPTFQRLSHAVRNLHRRRDRPADSVGETWEAWWAAVEKEPALERELAVRRQRFPSGTHGEEEFTREFHVAAMEAAGFREVESVWGGFENHVLLGVR